MYSPVHILQGARHIVTTLGNVVTDDGLGFVFWWIGASTGKGLSLFELLFITGIALRSGFSRNYRLTEG
jgi:hypothetical protein